MRFSHSSLELQLHSHCLAHLSLSLWEESDHRAYAGWGRCRPLLLIRVASRRRCNWMPEGDGDSRKCDSGRGCRDVESEQYGCGRADRQSHTHSSHEKV